MIYGYARISTKKQSIDRQVRNIKQYNADTYVMTEAYTGTKMDRPEWNKLMKAIKPGDTIVFDSVSRMSRDAEEGYTVYEALYSKGIELVFLKEPQINTATYKEAMSGKIEVTINSGDTATDELMTGIIKELNKYILALAKKQIMLAFEQSQKEVDDLHQRTKEGIQTARLNGKQIGRASGSKLTTKKSIEAKQIIRKHSKSFEGTLTDEECMKLAGITHNSFYKYKREIKAEQDGEGV